MTGSGYHDQGMEQLAEKVGKGCGIAGLTLTVVAVAALLITVVVAAVASFF